jgi:hypothetical protein
MHYRVAERLGFKSVAELVDNLPKEELTNWLTVCWIDGWGEEYLRMGHVVKELHDIVNAIFGYLGVNITKADFKTVEQCMPRQARAIRRKQKPVIEESEVTVPAADPTTSWMEWMISIHGKRG